MQWTTRRKSPTARARSVFIVGAGIILVSGCCNCFVGIYTYSIQDGERVARGPGVSDGPLDGEVLGNGSTALAKSLVAIDICGSRM